MNTWKKVGLALLGLGIVTFSKVTAQAAPTDTIAVVVQVQVVSVSITTTTWSLTNEQGTVSPGSVRVSSAIAVLNDGNVQEDYRLSLAEEGGIWSPSEADATAGTNEFVLLGLFTNTPTLLLNNDDFNDLGGADDVITTSASTATGDQYAINGDATGVKGFDVASSALRSLYLNFRAPTANTDPATQFITVTVTAIAG